MMRVAALFPWSRRLPVAELEEIDRAFAPDELGPTPAAEAVFIGDSRRVVAGTTDREAWVLAVLAKRARLLFEFGTASGRTAYLWARNAPADARVVTLTLPVDAPEYTHDARDGERDRRDALNTPRHERFRYSGTPVEERITQLYGDSKQLDETPYAGRCDLIFVDGSHAYSYACSDSEKALRMLAPGGLVLWHDYGRTRGVTRYLHQLSASREIRQLRGTSLAAHRAPS